MHSSDIDFKVHEEIEVGEIIAKSIFLAAIEVGKIIAKFDISGRIWPTCIRIYKLARTPNIEYGTSDNGQTVPPSNRESHSLKR